MFAAPCRGERRSTREEGCPSSVVRRPYVFKKLNCYLYYGYGFTPFSLMLNYQSLNSELRFKNTYGYADYVPAKIPASASPPP